MAATRWNDAEDAALEGLSMLAQLLYLRVFRAKMDYVTGISGGLVRRNVLRYSTLAERVAFVPCPGSTRKAWRPSLEELRAAVCELERAGLLIESGSSKEIGLVKRLPLADVDESVQKGNPTGTPREPHSSNPTGSAAESFRNNNDVPEVNDTLNPTYANPSCGAGTPQHPVSGIRIQSSPVVVGVESIGVDGEERPRSVGAWFEFFASGCGVRFEHRKIHTAKNGHLFSTWVGRGVCVGDVLKAMTLAHGQLCGALPDGPAYYGWAVDAVLQARLGGGDGSSRAGGGRRSGADILAAGCADAFG